MGVPETWYTKIAPASNSGTSETRLLNEADSFFGDRDFGANTLVGGDVLLLRAAGVFTSSDTTGIEVRVRQYLLVDDETLGQILVADTGVITNLAVNTSHKEWLFQSMLTIRTAGANGTLNRKAFFAGLIQGTTDPSIAFAGAPGTANIDTTVAHWTELTVTMTGNGLFQLEQCSIEKLRTP